ncbi:MAG: fructosamine kinase family protein, partial [Rikenellaceae bacterium]|nr:fructosamine kinase family protein [Rikenellaceae bacterium]
GLRELATSGEIRTAEVLEVGEDYLLTGYIESRTPQGNFFDRFGRQLARMHRHTSAMFGFREDNFIGENPQPNVPQGTEGGNWPEFFWNKRLLFQYRMAEKKGWVSTDLRAAFLLLETRIYRLLGEESREPPSLLHGDLWSGNFLCDCENRPVLIDPAVYYGHREAELAMTRLFGGFPPAFYKAYEEEFPLPPGWPERHNLYALYHVLNHLNLFGRAYLLQAEQLAESYV